MPQKTTIQNLIETLERKINSLKDIRYRSSDPLEVVRLSGKIDGLEIVLQDCKYELPNERQQIIDAYNDGYRSGEKESSSSLSDKDISNYDDALNYYNQNYNPCQNQKQ